MGIFFYLAQKRLVKIYKDWNQFTNFPMVLFMAKPINIYTALSL